jgi:hypothetical protein
MVRRRGNRLWAVALASVVVCGLAACSTDDGGGGITAEPTGELTVTPQTPAPTADGKAPVVNGSQVTLGGAAQWVGPSLGSKRIVISASTPDGLPLPCSCEGAATDAKTGASKCTAGKKKVAWNCGPFDTTGKDAKGNPKFKEAASVSLNVHAELSDGSASADNGVALAVDNNLPLVVFESPTPNEAVIGRARVKGSIADKTLATVAWSATIDGAPAGPEALLLEDVAKKAAQQPAVLANPQDPAKAGKFDFWLTLTAGGSRKVVLTATVTDKAGNQVQQALAFTVLKAPAFLGDNSPQGKGFADATPDPVQDMAATDLDGDGLVDVVVATKQGIVVRKGRPAPEVGRFDWPPLTDPGKTADPDWRYRRLPGLDARIVRLADLNADGRLDVLALGLLEQAPTAWVLLNLSTPGAPRLRKVDATPLPDEPLSAVIVDINKPLKAQGQPDLVVGGKSVDKGLSVLQLLEPAEQLCTCKGFKGQSCADPAVLDCLTQSTGDVSMSLFSKDPKKLMTFIDKGVTGIRSIAVADFYKDGNTTNGKSDGLPDLCVGEESRPRISCYRNDTGDGTLRQPQDSYIFYDAGVKDSAMVLATEFTSNSVGKPEGALDGPDLLVSTNTGLFRWLRGDHNGGFTYKDGDRFFLGSTQAIGSVAQLGIGPGGAPYLMAVNGGRGVVQYPLQVTDNAWASQCQREWVAGETALRVASADVDKDGKPDLLVLDGASGGVHFIKGLDNADFQAPPVYHACGLLNGGWGPRELAVAEAGDFTKDGLPELLLVTTTADSMQPGTNGVCTTPTGAKTYWPVYVFDLYLNVKGADGKGRINPTPRTGEFAPYAGKDETEKSGAPVVNCEEAPHKLGDIVDAKLADMNNDNILDLVSVREVEYTLGSTSDPSSDPAACSCLWGENREVDNAWGPDSPADKPDKSKCCRNYTNADKEKKTPRSGYGGGAALNRGSLQIWTSTDVASPFGLSAKAVFAPGVAPPLVRPTFAQAGGMGAVGVAVAPFDSDKFLDVVTVMPSKGSRTKQFEDPPYKKDFLAPRLRFFKGLGNGQLQPSAQQDTTKLVRPASGLAYDLATTYIVVDEQPLEVKATAFCATSELPTVFTLNSGTDSNTVSVVQDLGNLKMKPAVHTSLVESGLTDLSIDDLDDSKCKDILMAANTSVGLLSGLPFSPFFAAKKNLLEGQANAYSSVQIIDANGDGFKDLLLIDPKRGGIDLFLGDGQGHLVAYDGHLLVAPSPSHVSQTDLDKDGCVDLLVRSKQGATVLRNAGCSK